MANALLNYINARLPDLGHQEDVNFLKRLQLNGGLSNFDGGFGFGGRIGYEVNPNFAVGLTGSGYKVKTPYGIESRLGVDSIDARYINGLNEISAEIGPGMWNLQYGRKW